MTAQADLQRVIGSLQQRFSRPLNTRELRTIGDLASEAIFRRTKGGRGVKVTGGNRFPLKKLSSQYIDFRKSFKNLSSDTSPSKSNLTLTGQMLASVRTGKVKKGTRGKASIDVSPSGVFNKKKAEWNADRGRTFMNLSKVELRDINEYITKAIKKSLKKRL